MLTMGCGCGRNAKRVCTCRASDVANTAPAAAAAELPPSAKPMPLGTAPLGVGEPEPTRGSDDSCGDDNCSGTGNLKGMPDDRFLLAIAFTAAADDSSNAAMRAGSSTLELSGAAAGTEAADGCTWATTTRRCDWRRATLPDTPPDTTVLVGGRGDVVTGSCRIGDVRGWRVVRGDVSRGTAAAPGICAAVGCDVGGRCTSTRAMGLTK